MNLAIYPGICRLLEGKDVSKYALISRVRKFKDFLL